MIAHIKALLKLAVEPLLLLYAAGIFVSFVPIAFIIRIKKKNYEKPQKPRKVFIGVEEIANNIASMKGVLQQNGILVDHPARLGNYYYLQSQERRSELALRLALSAPLIYIERIKHLFSAMLNADQIWFIWHKSFLPYNLDYILIRIASVDLVVQHCGDDVRSRHLHDKIFAQYTPGIISGPYPAFPTLDMIRKIYRQWMAEKFAKVLSFRNQATFQMSATGHFLFSQKQILEAPKKSNLMPVILHAPTDKKVKRTDIVLAAIDILKERKLGFEFILLENAKNSEVIQTLKNVDIIIDQPATWPGRLAIEGASASCAVISGNHHEFMAMHPCPMHQFTYTPQSLADTLQPLILSHEHLNQNMEETWNFWKLFYSEEAFFKKYLQIWNGSYNRFPPLPDQKDLLLSGARNKIERLIIQIFYKPKHS